MSEGPNLCVTQEDVDKWEFEDLLGLMEPGSYFCREDGGWLISQWGGRYNFFTAESLKLLLLGAMRERAWRDARKAEGHGD